MRRHGPCLSTQFLSRLREPPPCLHLPPAGDPVRCVMECHEMSCSGARPAGPSVCCLLCIGLPSCSRFVPFAPPPACLRRVPFSRVSHALACARSAPALFARLIARASKRKTHFSYPFLRGIFRAAAKTKQPPDAASFCLILPLISENQVLIQDLFLYCANLSGRIATRASSAMPSPSPAPAAPGKAQPPKAEDVSRHIAICHEMSLVSG